MYYLDGLFNFLLFSPCIVFTFYIMYSNPSIILPTRFSLKESKYPNGHSTRTPVPIAQSYLDIQKLFKVIGSDAFNNHFTPAKIPVPGQKESIS